MKTIKSTPIAKFLTDHNLHHLLAGVADMPPSVPLLVWLNDAVQDDPTLKAKHKQTFDDLCKAELDVISKQKNDHSRESVRRDENTDHRRRGRAFGMLSIII